MKVCLKCGYRDHEQWRHSRFDFDADYMRIEEAREILELRKIVIELSFKNNFEPYIEGPYTYYRRGTGGIWLYRVLNENFRVPRERKNHTVSLAQVSSAKKSDKEQKP
jgi:hypothetical protein